MCIASAEEEEEEEEEEEDDDEGETLSGHWRAFRLRSVFERECVCVCEYVIMCM
jgi:hypothetical protein